jgi:hypothetical protein
MKLSDNGVLAIYVPAFQILFSELDSQVGHYRRYSRKDLRQKLRQSGFEVEKIVYVDKVVVQEVIVEKIVQNTVIKEVTKTVEVPVEVI